MILNNKRAQITLFVIIGLVLLLGTSLFFFYFTSKKNVVLIDENEHKIEVKLKNFQKFCVENMVDSFSETANSQGGYFSAMPAESLFYGNNVYALAYSENGEGLLATKDEISSELSEFIPENIGSCLNGLIDADKSLQNYDVDITLSSFSVEPNNLSLNIFYDYVFIVDDETFSGTIIQSVYFSLFSFLNRANELADIMLESYIEPDIFFNLQNCLTLNAEYGVRPQFPIDFVKNLTSDDFNSLIFGDDFVILNLTQNHQSFPFAMKPPLVGSIC